MEDFFPMNRSSDLTMTEHPAWLPFDGGRRRVFASSDGGRYLCVARGREVSTQLLADGDEPISDDFVLASGALRDVPELAGGLKDLGTVTRFRNADLWNAIGTAIIRQVIRAGQSKKLYRAFCEAHGERVDLPDGDSYALFPSPEAVLDLSEEQYSSIGMAFKRRPLMAAAEAYVEHGEKWRELSPHALIDELQSVPRIGPWTAHAAVADWGNDWALYPYADLAVRTWAGRAAPSYDWPADEPTFGEVWRALANDHLSTITLLTLAWGSCHGDIG
jgi:DNA-3-methyladenine glycosylase II